MFLGNVPTNLPNDIALCIYRVAQESLRNVAKHAGVNKASVKLLATDRELILQFSDEGVGFQSDNGNSQPGIGLSSMEERIHLVNGSFKIKSEPGHGTTVEVRVPLEEHQTMNKARILIADDHQILAEGIRGLLEPEFEVVGVVSNGRELVAAAKKQRPDVIVADISMPSLNGIEAAIQIRDAGLTAKVVFLTMHRDVAYARQAIEAGAAGYVLKHSVSSELVTAIHDALQGQTYISPIIAGELLQSYRQGESVDGASAKPLTPRQREVLQLIAEGHSAKQIAAVLKVSVRTAEAHKAHIMDALELRSTAELVQYAIRNGIISID